MAAHFRHSGHVLRFIEYMDVGTTNGWRLEEVVPAAEIISLIGGQWPLEPVAPAYHGEVASRYRDGAGEIGVIASVTQPFCRGCARARLSADGRLYTCLFAGAGTTCAARCAQDPVTRRCASRSPLSGPGGPTAFPSCARARPAARR
jgi:cyclic pyranopterin phosphate synthase